MMPHPAPAETHSPADQAAEDAVYYRGVLHELIDLGTDLARMLHGQVKAQTEAEASAGAGTVPELAAAFDRVSRAVRRSIALARTLSDPVPPPRAAAANDDARRTVARKRIIREVEDTIQRTVGEREAEALHAELCERLDAPDLDDDIRGRPTADVIADICRDLGVAITLGAHPWKRRTPADVAALSARAAAPRAARPPGAIPGLAVVPPSDSPGASEPAANDPAPGLAAGPTTPLLHAARFRGK